MKHMDKKVFLGIFLAALLIALSLAPTPGCGPGLDPGTDISKDDALEILVSDIIQPAAEYKELSAFMLSQPLQDGDVVTSESGETYTIDGKTWFIFIDDDPMAFFAHDCRYVFIDAQTGAYDVVDEMWPPEINDYSMWDTAELSRGNMITLYSVLDSALPIAGSASTGPAGDYGDAPDGQDAYWGVPGSFPTLYDTTNSHFDRPGAHTLNTGEEMLGMHVSVEVDATDPDDPDGVPNLVDADSDERIFVIIEGTQAKLAFTVTVASTAPAVDRYVNALIDFDQDGSWSEGAQGDEWVVVNLEVDVAPGSSETVITSWFPWGSGSDLPSPVWMRLLLTREQVDEALFASVGGWDGSGQFQYGEVEDYFVFLTDQPALPEYTLWPPPGPPDDPDPPDPEPPGPEEGPCGYNINYYALIISGGDELKHIIQGTPIAQEAVATMTGLTAEQGYTLTGTLGPGNNSLSQIGDAFDNLVANANCGDRILIYICGHGYPPDHRDYPDGGIALKDVRGKTQEVMTPQDLGTLLNKIPACPDQPCPASSQCCSITVLIESCYAGHFNVAGVPGEGRMVIGTSDDTPSWTPYCGGGYTQAWARAMRDPASDTDGDGAVDPIEAHQAAQNAIDEFNARRGRNQSPWSDEQYCDCICPCDPSIDADKWVWDQDLGDWADETEASPGDIVSFRLEVENDGECTSLLDPEIVDMMQDGLQYSEGSSLVFFNGEPLEIEPTLEEGEGVTILTWYFEDMVLLPGETIAIEFQAQALAVGPNTNMFTASALCAADPELVLSADAEALVMVMEG